MSAIITAKAYQDMMRRPKKSKYRAVPTLVDGIRFDSKGEARRYQDLELLRRAGEITNLRRQAKIILHASTNQEVGSYVADFSYEESGLTVLEDFKGHDTPLSAWKRRHVEAEYGVKVRLIRAS